MANLVSPGYKNSTLIGTILAPSEERVIEFKGLNRRTTVDEGEMSAMQNLTAENYPVLTPRRPRGTFRLPNGAVEPLKIMERFERIAMIAKKSDGSVAFFYNRTEITEVTGLTEDTEMVAINTKICFFPQKTYLTLIRTGSVVQSGDYGNLEQSDTLSGATLGISNEDARLTLSDASGYAYDDALIIDGTLNYTDSEGTVHTGVSCTVSCIIEEVSGNVLVLPRESFIELTGDGATNITYSGSLSRTMPDLDHVIEWGNRLWGVSNITNTVYACKLGDPKNWQYYQGTSLDSFYAEQGTDEDWTGCAAYSGHLILFKQNSMTKIYGTAPSNFQIVNAVCYGVEEGSENSIAIINDTVFYKSTIGIMAYNGGVPYCVSDKLNMKFKNVVGGTEGINYYASVQREDNTHEILVLDVQKAMWHREDDVRFRDCCTMDGSLYFISDVATDSFEANKVYIINPETATETYEGMHWMATFGPFDEYLENRKIYSKLSLRFKANGTSTANVYIALNEGEWELVKAFTNIATEGEFIPIVPRRCDRYSIKIEGTGNCEIKTLTRRVRRGTGGKL